MKVNILAIGITSFLCMLVFALSLFHFSILCFTQQTSTFCKKEFCFKSYQLVSSFRDGVLSSLSGRKSISFMMLASRTGSSCLRKTNEVFSQALADPAVT